MKGFLMIACVAVLAPFAAANDLGPGDPAPLLNVKAWIKGDPVGEPAPMLSVNSWIKGDHVTELEKGKTYVIEFWATWCGPCIQSIPHLTEVAHKNPDVTFVGVSVWEDDKDRSVEKFVDDMGAKMDYHVAYSGNQDGMAQTWMKAAAQNGIPAAFIVKDGVIQWVGHPMAIEGPLSEVKAGAFDLKRSRAQFDQEAIETHKQMALNDELSSISQAFKDGKHEEAKQRLAALEAKEPMAKRAASSFRFQWLAKEDVKAWTEEAERFARSKRPEELALLRSYALQQASERSGDPATGHKAIELAIGAAPDDLLTLRYAAIVYEQFHEYAKAQHYVSRVLSVLPDKPDNADLRKDLQKKQAELSARMKH